MYEDVLCENVVMHCHFSEPFLFFPHIKMHRKEKRILKIGQLLKQTYCNLYWISELKKKSDQSYNLQIYSDLLEILNFIYP